MAKKKNDDDGCVWRCETCCQLKNERPGRSIMRGVRMVRICLGCVSITEDVPEPASDRVTQPNGPWKLQDITRLK